MTAYVAGEGSDAPDDEEGAKAEDGTATASLPTSDSGRSISRVVAVAVLPALSLLLGTTAGVLRWEGGSREEADRAAAESVAAAKDATVAILSYQPATVETDLESARERLTAPFLDDYTKLIKEVVIPGSKAKGIAAAARVSSAGSISATTDHAVVLAFVDQTTTVGKKAPTNTSSSVRIGLKKVGERWLVSGFDPV